ncbi:hypothetical protein OS493_006312 [Desmophyllum pertusum]|uniref:Uncharacterized protein n=1 Tax=Desmophyllum pertusum TaxID=174260 RepID=A0A9X0DBA5_9CNID|nr:hypothetical protein OS493_006312 [Desmophyllum pertusum]
MMLVCEFQPITAKSRKAKVRGMCKRRFSNCVTNKKCCGRAWTVCKIHRKYCRGICNPSYTKCMCRMKVMISYYC